MRESERNHLAREVGDSGSPRPDMRRARRVRNLGPGDFGGLRWGSGCHHGVVAPRVRTDVRSVSIAVHGGHGLVRVRSYV